jgi:hypothetical protein
MLASRRRFLKMVLVAAGGVAVASAGSLGLLKGAWRRLVFPVLEPEPTGPLSGQALGVLLAATEALVNHPFEKDHYTDFFRWRAEHLPGHRALYERFAVAVNRSAKQSFGCDFAGCAIARRRTIMETATRVRAATSRFERLRVGLRERDWWLFDPYIIRPITSLFARTDAWPLVGYDAWPGTPRGLERYTRPPAT